MSKALDALVRGALAAHATAYSTKARYRAERMEEQALSMADREGYYGYSLRQLRKLSA